jgi:hypothetical protein
MELFEKKNGSIAGTNTGGSSSSASPTALKCAMAFFAPYFAGYLLHHQSAHYPTFDSKISAFLGLMAMYLSILHENFNITEVLIIALKPWIEADQDGEYLTIIQ